MPTAPNARSISRSILRRLLQLDRPAPPVSEAEFQRDVERHYRWNFAVNAGDVATFFFGISFISSSTVVPLFISKLSSSPLPIGLAAVIAQSAWFLPQLFTANRVERLARKKPVAVNLGFFLERLPMWLLVVAAALAAQSPTLALALFLIGYAWHGLGAGTVATAWQDMLARCFPVNRRGRFFGFSMFVGTGTGIAGAALTAAILTSFPFPNNFVVAFFCAATCITVSWLFLALTREPLQAVDAPRQSEREYWKQLPDIPRRDDNFRRFLIARLLMALGGMATGFITVSAIQRWGISDDTVSAFTAALLIGQSLGTLSFGFLADRRGHKLSLEISAAASATALIVALLATSPSWYYLVFGLLGVALSAVIVSGIFVVMEFSGPQRRPTYIGIANTMTGLASVAAPLIGAALAAAGYGLLFAVAAVVNLTAAMLMRWWVREPRVPQVARAEAHVAPGPSLAEEA